MVGWNGGEPWVASRELGDHAVDVSRALVQHHLQAPSQWPRTAQFQPPAGTAFATQCLLCAVRVLQAPFQTRFLALQSLDAASSPRVGLPKAACVCISVY